MQTSTNKSKSRFSLARIYDYLFCKTNAQEAGTPESNMSKSSALDSSARSVSTNAAVNISILFPLALFVFLLILNAAFPTQSDSMGATFGGIDAALLSYMNWNGRLGDMLSVGFGNALSVYTIFYAPINAAVGAVFFYLVFVVMFARIPFSKAGSEVFDLGIMSLAIFALIYGFRGFGAVFFWAAGSFNYLWAWDFTLFFILVYRLFWDKIAKDNSPKIRKGGVLAI